LSFPAASEDKINAAASEAISRMKSLPVINSYTMVDGESDEEAMVV
jgi:hypothetical protein